MEPLNKEKRIKREIANSNERRRMQSINAGFQKLKRLLPVNDGEKISKANILQHAADFITNIERDRIMLAEQNTLLRRILLDLKGGKIDLDTALSPVDSPTANSMLSVPLKLTMADLDSQDSTPASTPRRSPSSPNFETTTGISPLTTPTMLLATSIKTSKTAASAQGAAITTSNIVNSNNQIQSAATKTTKTTRTPKNPRKTTRSTSKNSANNSERRGQAGRNTKHAGDMVARCNQNVNMTTASSVSNTLNSGVGGGGDHSMNDLIGCNNNNNNNNNNSALNMSCSAIATSDMNNQSIGSVAEIISDKNASPKNGLQTPGGAAKAAIALPLEVPYTSEVVIKSSTHSHHHAPPPPLMPAVAHHHPQQRPGDDFEAELMTGARKLLKTSGGCLPNLDVQDGGASKGQNLDTICKAIMEIEGDRVFKSEKLEP